MHEITKQVSENINELKPAEEAAFLRTDAVFYSQK